MPLTLLRAEMLALLDSHSQGWSAEELAYELYGDAGTAQAIRTEMFRVRSMLGDAVESNPYRLAAGLAGCTDPGRVLRLLREGQVAEALEAYTAPMLSRSGALSVQLLREPLDLAVESAVRSSDDAEVIIRWLSTDVAPPIREQSRRLDSWSDVGMRSTCRSGRPSGFELALQFSPPKPLLCPPGSNRTALWSIAPG